MLGAFLVEPVRERRRGRLVDDAEDVEPGDLAGVLGRLALRVVEVRGDGDDGVRDRLAEVRLGVGLELLEDHRRDLRRCVLLALGLDADVVVRALDDLVRDDLHLLRDLVVLAAHEALDREDRVLRVRDLLALRGCADEPLAVTPEGDDGRSRASALGVRDDGGLGSFEDGHARVGRPEVDADGLCHSALAPLVESLQCEKPESHRSRSRQQESIPHTENIARDAVQAPERWHPRTDQSRRHLGPDHSLPRRGDVHGRRRRNRRSPDPQPQQLSEPRRRSMVGGDHRDDDRVRRRRAGNERRPRHRRVRHVRERRDRVVRDRRRHGVVRRVPAAPARPRDRRVTENSSRPSRASRGGSTRSSGSPASGRCRSARRRRRRARHPRRAVDRRAPISARTSRASSTPHSDSVATSGETTDTSPR